MNIYIKMFTNKTNVIVFSIIIAIVDAFIGIGRKHHLNRYSVHTITLIDTILTGAVFFIILLSNSSIKDIVHEIGTFSMKDWAIFLVTSIGIATSVLLGRLLLQNNSIAYLGMLETGIDLLATVVLAYFIYNEKLTLQKIIGLAMIVGGIIFVH